MDDLSCVIAACCIVLVCAASCRSGEGGRTASCTFPALPREKPITIDGRLDEWDRSGGVTVCMDTATLMKTHRADAYAAYDDDALYLAFRIVDETPMVNMVDPEKDPERGWGGDCVQVRFKASPPDSGEVVYLDCRYYSEGKTPAMTIQYPDLAANTPARPTVDALAEGAEAAFAPFEDGGGYVQEMRVPWTLLLPEDVEAAPGAIFRMGLEFVWNGKKPFAEAHRAVDLVAFPGAKRSGFYMRPQSWGRLLLAEHGNLSPAQLEEIRVTEVPGARDRSVRRVTVRSSKDGTLQPALFFAPTTKTPLPLLVALHSWSTDFESAAPYARHAERLNWNMIAPDFRGPNNRPEACASDLAVQDVVDAVAWAKENASVDPDRVYLLGGSGGGHMALVMAGRRPELWTAVSAWVPISDLAAWHAQCKGKGGFGRYAEMLEKVCGGPPGASDAADAEYRKRSPLTHLPNAKGRVRLDINTGIHDGHTGSVPVSHALRAFNAVARPEDRLTDEEIRHMVEKEEIPEHLRPENPEAAYKGENVLFRRESATARITVFEGGHAVLHEQALGRLAQLKGRPGDETVKDADANAE